MKRLLASVMLVLMLGCTTGNKYVEGTMTQLGVYAPIDGQLVGAEVVNYMNGCKVTSISNLPFKVDRVYSATNSYLWGMVTTTESTHTKVEMTK